MQLPINHFKRALRERRAQIGLWLSAGSPYVTEAVAGSGFDWLLIDTDAKGFSRTLLPKMGWHSSDTAALYFAGRACMRVLDNAVQIHGGMGFMFETEANRLYRSGKVMEMGEMPFRDDELPDERATLVFRHGNNSVRVADLPSLGCRRLLT